MDRPPVIPPGARLNTAAIVEDLYCNGCQDTTPHYHEPSEDDQPTRSASCSFCQHRRPIVDDSVMRRVQSSMAGRTADRAIIQSIPNRLEFVPLESNLEGMVLHRAKAPGGWLVVDQIDMGFGPCMYIPDPSHRWI